jgi:hypothetical protein
VTTPGFRDLDFEARTHLDQGARLEMIGNADGRVVAELEKLVDELHAKVVAARVHAIAVDIRALEFMNASCFNVFVNWIGMITELPDGERYRLEFVSNPAIPWQRRSLRTLACFATDLVKVDG